jgi:hypothetical protein
MGRPFWTPTFSNTLRLSQRRTGNQNPYWRKDQKEREEREARIRAGHRSFADGFNGGTWDDD